MHGEPAVSRHVLDGALLLSGLPVGSWKHGISWRSYWPAANGCAANALLRCWSGSASHIRIIEDSPRAFIDAELDAALPQTVVIAHPIVKEQTKGRQVIQGVY